jgi:hypothetical protein
MNSRVGPSNVAFTDQRLCIPPVKGGHHRCSPEQELLIGGLMSCPSGAGTTDALDSGDY